MRNKESQVTADMSLVDDKCRTNIPGIWAVGDLIPTLQLAHVGFAEGIMVAEEIAGLNPRPINYDGIPRVTIQILRLHPSV
jgi:dihydrolipoamide dehydrogenase